MPYACHYDTHACVSCVACGAIQAHSSILVLPCGAGKTLVGITVSSIIKKCILVFCTSMMAVNQWREQFLKWSDIEPSRISRYKPIPAPSLPPLPAATD